ncbi:DUF3013 family protein [Enterococcus sp. LJL99]
MKKETMLTYLDDQINKNIDEYDLAIDWDKKNHSIEVIIRLFAENKENEQIGDIEGTLSEEEYIEFEDGILFYNPAKSQPDSEDYLALIPYEGKKGIKKSVLDGFVVYLKDVLADGQSDLLDFLSNEAAELFELNWSQELFEQAVRQYENKTTDTYIAYPSY